jgi:hypothetical protein
MFKYLVERRDGLEWKNMQSWQMEPYLLRRFLKAIVQMYGLDPNNVRVRRTKQPWVTPKFQFQPDGSSWRIPLPEQYEND